MDNTSLKYFLPLSNILLKYGFNKESIFYNIITLHEILIIIFCGNLIYITSGCQFSSKLGDSMGWILLIIKLFNDLICDHRLKELLHCLFARYFFLNITYH